MTDKSYWSLSELRWWSVEMSGPGLTICSPWQDYNPQWHSSAVGVNKSKVSNCTVWHQILLLYLLFEEGGDGSTAKAAVFSLPLIFRCPPGQSFCGFLLLLLFCTADIPKMLSADLSQN